MENLNYNLSDKKFISFLEYKNEKEFEQALNEGNIVSLLSGIGLGGLVKFLGKGVKKVWGNILSKNIMGSIDKNIEKLKEKLLPEVTTIVGEFEKKLKVAKEEGEGDTSYLAKEYVSLINKLIDKTITAASNSIMSKAKGSDKLSEKQKSAIEYEWTRRIAKLEMELAEELHRLKLYAKDDFRAHMKDLGDKYTPEAEEEKQKLAKELGKNFEKTIMVILEKEKYKKLLPEIAQNNIRLIDNNSLEFSNTIMYKLIGISGFKNTLEKIRKGNKLTGPEIEEIISSLKDEIIRYIKSIKK